MRFTVAQYFVFAPLHLLDIMVKLINPYTTNNTKIKSKVMTEQ